MPDLHIILPEIILAAVALLLFLLGCSKNPAIRRVSAIIAISAMVCMFLVQIGRNILPPELSPTLWVDEFGQYIRLLALLMGALLALLSFPTNDDASGNSALELGHDTGEYFGLFTLSVTGLILLCAANDMIVLFLALELVSIPTYVMVSMSRGTPLAQEAGLKYFFLGALSVALMLFGFSYLFGATGKINLTEIANSLQSSIRTHGSLPTWQLLAVVLVLVGLAYKLAAFPLHFYAGDVYEGAGTSVTAFLAFVPKAAGIVATVKILHAVGGDDFRLPHSLVTMLWVIAAITMSVGNLLGLLQTNIKRTLAYSSIAHSGYMLVGVASLAGAPHTALAGVIFYLTAYGLMNVGAFGVLMLLPSRDGKGSAETFEDLAGQGRKNVPLGLAMTVSCFSLIGLPLTVGFFGKLFLISPALAAGNLWLVIILVANAAVSAGYYLRIVGTMFLRPMPASEGAALKGQFPIVTAVVLSVVGTLLLGSVPQLAQMLSDYASTASLIKQP
ncbi:MAG: NADH-quinone oxidoreductase subunit N [Tepidisphaerales bacterium]